MRHSQGNNLGQVRQEVLAQRPFCVPPLWGSFSGPKSGHVRNDTDCGRNCWRVRFSAPNGLFQGHLPQTMWVSKGTGKKLIKTQNGIDGSANVITAQRKSGRPGFVLRKDESGFHTLYAIGLLAPPLLLLISSCIVERDFG